MTYQTPEGFVGKVRRTRTSPHRLEILSTNNGHMLVAKCHCGYRLYEGPWGKPLSEIIAALRTHQVVMQAART